MLRMRTDLAALTRRLRRSRSILRIRGSFRGQGVACDRISSLRESDKRAEHGTSPRVDLSNSG